MKKHFFLTLFLAGMAASGAQAQTETLKLRVAPERDLVLRGASREVVVQIELEGRRPDPGKRAPMNLALVLDRSGSMTGAKIEKAKQAACIAIDRLDENDFVSVIIYDNTPEVLIEPQRIESARQRDELKRRIEKIKPGGGTAIHAGVTMGAAQLRKHLDQERLSRVILLSDGLANSGPSRTSDLSELGSKLRAEGLSVTTIGLGDDYNEDLMAALAEASQANYYYVQDAEKLPGIFADELGSARTVLARKVTIRIEVPAGVKLREIIGHPEIDCKAQSAEITLPEYFGSDKRRFLVRCVVEAPGKEPLAVAHVALGYEEIASGKTATQSQAATIKFTDEAKDSEKSLRGEVAQAVSVWENRADKERAIKLADEGKPEQAAAVMRSRSAANAAAPAPAQIPNLEQENRALETRAAEVLKDGALSKSSRKQVQFENWQDKYQKR